MQILPIVPVTILIQNFIILVEDQTQDYMFNLVFTSPYFLLIWINFSYFAFITDIFEEYRLIYL